MKYVSAIIQPSRRNDIELGLAEIGLHDVTVTESAAQAVRRPYRNIPGRGVCAGLFAEAEDRYYR